MSWGRGPSSAVGAQAILYSNDYSETSSNGYSGISGNPLLRSTTTALVAGQWQHVMFVRTVGTSGITSGQFYRNGQPNGAVSSAAGVAPVSFAGAADMGAGADTRDLRLYFSGYLGTISIVNTEYSAQRVALLYQSQARKLHPISSWDVISSRLCVH